jgi:hypothetical protein
MPGPSLQQTAGAKPGAVELISIPLRIAIFIALSITSGGVVWACLARIPVYVNGTAYMIKLGDIDGLTALTDGQVYYQFSASQLIRKPLFERLYAFTQNPKSFNSDQVTDLSQELLKRRPDGPHLDVNSLYPGLVPQGQVLAWIDSPLIRNALEAKMLSYNQANRDLRSKQAELDIVNRKINLKLKILKQQLQSETEFLNDIRELLKIKYASRVNLLTQKSKVDDIKTSIISEQEELAANAQKAIDAQTILQQALIDLQNELNNYVACSFIFAPSSLYIVDINAPQSGPVKNQDNILHISNQKPRQLPNSIPGFLSQSDAEQVSAGMKVMLTPMGMDRAQFGGIIGTVQDVSRLPSNQEQIAERTGSLAIAQAVTSMIPDPVRVDLRLERDPQDKEPNHGGFRWSSPGSPPFGINVGGQLSLQITTQRVQPISLLIPSVMKLSGASPPTISPQRSLQPIPRPTP